MAATETDTKKKIVTISFLVSGVVTALVVRVLLETLAATWGQAALLWGQTWFKHGVPVGIGLGTFLFFQFHPQISAWADEAVLEVSKVVWPTKKDTTGMTIVVCVMLIISGIVLGAFDFLSSEVVKNVILD